MFQKFNTYFIVYHLKGDSTNKFTFYVTSKISVKNQKNTTSAFKQSLEQLCIDDQNENYMNDVFLDNVKIEMINLLNTSFKLFGIFNI